MKFVMQTTTHTRASRRTPSTWTVGALVVAWVMGCSMGAQAADELSLQEAISAAQLHDKEYLASQTLNDTAQALRAQASSLWRPQVMVTGTAAKSSHSTQVAGAQFAQKDMGSFMGANFNTDINRGNALQWAVSAKQPIFNLARSAQSTQLNTAAAMTDVQKSGAEQGMVVRIAERYFDAQLAQQKMQLLSAQLNSTQKFAEEAKYRYEIGNRPITEVYEAQAQWSQTQAEHFGAQSDLQIKLQRLQDAIGHVPAPLPNSLSLNENLPKLEELNVWLSKARQNNLELKMQNLSLQNAQAKANEYALGASASLDLVGQMSGQRLTGDGDFGSASNRERSGMVGVQLSIPLYTGGYNSAKHQQAQAELKKAQLDLSAAQERVAQQVNGAWLGAQTAQRQVGALTQALKASEARLGATKTGQEVGHRTLLDVLNAQNQTTQTRIQLESAEQNYVLSRLRLGALVQELNPDVIGQMVK